MKEQAGHGLEHFFQPVADKWLFLFKFFALETLANLDLQRVFLMLGPCLMEAIGGF